MTGAASGAGTETRPMECRRYEKSEGGASLLRNCSGFILVSRFENGFPKTHTTALEPSRIPPPIRGITFAIPLAFGGRSEWRESGFVHAIQKRPPVQHPEVIVCVNRVPLTSTR